MLWDDFLNSEWRDWRGGGGSEDRLDRPDWIELWLKDSGLPALAFPNPEELASLKAFRELLLRIVRAYAAGGMPEEPDLERLNDALAEGPVIRRISFGEERWRLETVPVRKSWRQVTAEVAASFARTMAEGEASRIRICDNPDCLWVYYDDTRNRSKRYCDDKMCGNLMKVRRHRARKKLEKHGD